ncbi:MAG: lactonase family protein [Planctomycetes bacterium]|nr:lactonase family protein [Planctomycetota bacterium]
MRTLLLLLAFFLLPAISSAQTPAKFRVYLGTYTGKMSKGIYQCDLDLKDGKLSNLELAGEMNSPSFVAIHPNQKFLYAVGEAGGKKAGVVAFAIDAKTGSLTRLNDAPSGGAGPCHLVVDASGKTVLAANYGGGSCVSIPIAADGKLLDGGSFFQHKGKSILPNQKGPHGHSINVDKGNKFAFCADLGLDKILIYKLDADKGTMTPHGEFDTPAGSGPRHFAFHPNGKWAYTNGEMSMTLIAMDYDAAKGALTKKQIISTIPAGEKKKQFSTAEVVVHPSGKFVYVSNRDAYNSIAIFSINQKTGELAAVGHETRGVKTPRNFAIEPTGQYMLVANQSGNNVISFRINQSTGELTPTGSRVEVGAPVCVRFMSIGK